MPEELKRRIMFISLQLLPIGKKRQKRLDRFNLQHIVSRLKFLLEFKGVMPHCTQEHIVAYCNNKRPHQHLAVQAVRKNGCRLT